MIYEKWKAFWNDRIQSPLPRKPASSRLIGIYFQPQPDPKDDALTLFLFRKHTGFEYPILFFHPENRVPDSDFLQQFQITAIPLNSEHFRSKVSYSRYVCSESFYAAMKRHVPEAEFYLIFQSDSFLIRGSLEEYLTDEWDYIGGVWEKNLITGGIWAPQEPTDVVIDSHLAKQMRPNPIGNGGFTLRRIEPCMQIVKSHKISELNYEQEDVFYSLFGQLHGLRFAPLDVARRFSWEDPVAVSHYIRKLNIAAPIAFHHLPDDMAGLLLKSAML